MKRCERDPKTWRALREELRLLGAQEVRINGSHESWRFADGEMFIVVRNHLGDDVPIGILMKFRRLRRRRTNALVDDPLLLGWWDRGDSITSELLEGRSS